MKKSKEKDRLSHGYGYVIHDHIPNRICGSIYEIIESLGLKETQEHALKNLIQKSVWESISEKVLISSELHDKIRDKYWEIRNRQDRPQIVEVNEI